MNRFGFVLLRPFQLIPVLIGISVISFGMIHALPGDPVRTLVGLRATPEVIESIRYAAAPGKYRVEVRAYGSPAAGAPRSTGRTATTARSGRAPTRWSRAARWPTASRVRP